MKACAKINLGLNIVRKRDDGYHDLQTVFYPVPIFDEISIEVQSSNLQQQIEHKDVRLTMEGNPVDGNIDDNLVVKAYRLVASRYAIPPVTIRLNKQIPMQAGMGGGSADCAFTIRLLNEKFQLNMSISEMQRMATSLGADCPFFIEAKPAYAEGIGEILSPISLDLSAYQLAIVKPPVEVSTREAFAHIKPKQPDINCMDIVKRPIEEWRGLLKNDFEESIFPQYPIIGEAKQQLYEMGALYASMSGSGSALFAFFAPEAHPDIDAAFPSTWYRKLTCEGCSPLTTK